MCASENIDNCEWDSI